ncbi:MAG: aspartate carbamoyltransferase [Leptospiraceae bacterium]|nr:aspartate carbamoyltransferase [Leptospiraceae bacterium]MCP5497216.1 aspartate carbamoyltransferase [Leptospiraceae bacterium]
MVTEKLDIRLRNPIPIKDSSLHVTKLKKLITTIEEHPDHLLGLSNRHVVSARQFTTESVLQLIRLAANYESFPLFLSRPLAGKILITAFYEPSTRTRLSFESAWQQLGGDIMSITDPATTGMAKGESLEDIAEMFNNYCDVVVLRDTHEDSVYRMINSLIVPIVNAGNGIDEHPTQALADMYAIFRWRPILTRLNLPEEQKIKVGIIGNPSQMRTVRSLLLFFSLFSYMVKEIVIINPDNDIFSEGQREELESSGLYITKTGSITERLRELDVIYINSIAWIGDTYERLTSDLKLSKDSPLKPDSIILHPLARGKELDVSLDKTPHNWYFIQARGALFLRMALLNSLLKTP